MVYLHGIFADAITTVEVSPGSAPPIAPSLPPAATEAYAASAAAAARRRAECDSVLTAFAKRSKAMPAVGGAEGEPGDAQQVAQVAQDKMMA